MKTTKKLNKRQEYILNFIEQGGDFSVADVLSAIQKEFQDISRITIVRDLSFLVEQNILQRNGAGRSVKYSLSATYSLVKNVDVDKYFSNQQDKRKIKGHFNFTLLKILENDIFTKEEEEKLTFLHHEFQENFKKINSPAIIKKEFERMIIEFSWKSSQIEGNTYSLLDTEILIKEHKIKEGKTKEEAQMILNHKEAFDYVLQNRGKFKILSRLNIEEIHSLLISKLNISRNLRTSPVGIIGTNYKPIDNVFQIEEAIEKMVVLVNNKKSFFEKAFLLLILLSYIQAFEDGNKRVARMVSNAVLLAYGSTAMSYRAVSEVEYKKASLLFYETNNLSYFKEIFITQFEFAVKNYFQ